jgi:hypothetical protein
MSGSIVLAGSEGLGIPPDVKQYTSSDSNVDLTEVSGAPQRPARQIVAVSDDGEIVIKTIHSGTSRTLTVVKGVPIVVQMTELVSTTVDVQVSW